MSCHKLSKLKNTGRLLKKLRETHGLLLREVGSSISLDPTLLSKIEQNKRLPTKNQIIALANYYDEYKNEIISTWLSDKVLSELYDQPLAIEAINIARKKILLKKS